MLAASVKSSVRDIIGEQFTGDFVVSTNTFGFGGLSPELAEQLNELPEVEAAAGVQLGFGTIDGDVESLSVVDPEPASQVFDFDMLQGSMTDLDDQGVLISKSTADDKHLAVGDTVAVTLIDGTPRDLTVQGVYDKDELAGPYTVSKGFYAQAAPTSSTSRCTSCWPTACRKRRPSRARRPSPTSTRRATCRAAPSTSTPRPARSTRS